MRFFMPLFPSQNTDLLEISKDGKGHTERVHKLIYVSYNLYKITLPGVLRAKNRASSLESLCAALANEQNPN